MLKAVVLVCFRGLVPIFYVILYLSPFYYAYQAIIINQWVNVDAIGQFTHVVTKVNIQHIQRLALVKY